MNNIPFSVYDFFGYLSAGFLTIIAFEYAGGSTNVLHAEHTVAFGFAIIVFAYMVGHIIAHLSSVVFESWLVRKVLKPPEYHLLKTEADTTLTGKLFPGYFTPLPKDSQSRIIKKAEKYGISSFRRAFFFHCHTIVKKDSASLDRLNTFLNLYGFARNMAMALLLSATVLAISAVYHEFIYQSQEKPNHLLCYTVNALITSFFMFLRYLKFFRIYTMEVFLNYSENIRKGDKE